MNEIEKEIDKLGRVVLPQEFRDALELKANDKLFVKLENSTIILSKRDKFCVLCKRELKSQTDIPLCERCIAMIKSR